MRYLLDKSVVRRCLKGLVGGIESDDVRLSLRLLTTLPAEDLFISIQTLHILSHIVKVPQAQLITGKTSVLYPVKYTARWARRLRQAGFGREDAYLLALATFGTNQIKLGSILGVHVVITYDLRMQSHFQDVRPHLNERLHRMTAQLTSPYDQARLPEVYTPSQFK
jgi:hypothetical protein